MKKLSNFKNQKITFVESYEVVSGVTCDVYSYNNQTSKDLAIVTVLAGHKTPLQRVLQGSKTIEGFVSGEGALQIIDTNNEKQTYTFSDKLSTPPQVVQINQCMQWTASREHDLVFFEECHPPYKEGRFENIN